jgi:mono/diheme cytochrome c family protein
MIFKHVVVGLVMAVLACASLGRGTASAAQGKTQWDGVYTDAQAARGSAVYEKSCSSCHGAGLEGKDQAPSLSGAEFGAAWNELTLKDLFERMSKTMPQGAPGSLPPEQYADVLSFVLQKNGAPAGAAELSKEIAELTAIMYKMAK